MCQKDKYVVWKASKMLTIWICMLVQYLVPSTKPTAMLAVTILYA